MMLDDNGMESIYKFISNVSHTSRKIGTILSKLKDKSMLTTLLLRTIELNDSRMAETLLNQVRTFFYVFFGIF